MNEFELLIQAATSGGGAGAVIMAVVFYNKLKDRKNGTSHHPVTGHRHERRNDDSHTKLMIAEFEIKFNEKFADFKDDIYQKMSENKNVILEKVDAKFEKVIEKINDLK